MLKKVLILLAKCQAASDAAKGLLEENYLLYKQFNNEFEYMYSNSCYAIKDDCINNLVEIIDKSAPFGVRYYINIDLDQNGYESNVIYFTIKLNGRTYQMSFHNFNDKIMARAKGHNNNIGATICWDQRAGHSRIVAAKLLREAQKM